ncbi:NOP13 [Candida margitis]|uniref:NOP13 n=1 Tax=Candida margitis TaxID=1775924 RepID=UPI002227A344|nr:NOP13 [Candida margitis]KAI5969890.1 NOP13 [Candida margitis]
MTKHDSDETSSEQVTRKRKGDSFDELEIDLNASIPLSKKQKRLAKKGKLEEEPAPKITTVQESEQKAEKSKYGVWIGNLSFDTSKEDLVRFLVGKSSVKEDEITRVNVPKKGNQIKGFAYVDVQNEEQVNKLIELSEQNLNGRNLLIKNATSFEGRPEKESKLPPSRILFVGNLSFDTTEDNLQEHFQHCGEIARIRMATFQDTGKCKGFAFVDFKNEDGATTAMNSKLAKTMLNRKLRLEYGEDRSKRRPKSHTQNETQERQEFASEAPEITPQVNKRQYRERPQERPQKREKSSVALATAQRASAAIVPSSGKKITFD